jgi:catechol 2,3-dioxygenase
MAVRAIDTAILEALDAPAHIEKVALIVRDLAVVARFYQTVLGLDMLASGADRAELGIAGQTLVELVSRPEAPLAGPGEAGLFHIAFLLPMRRDLANWVVHAQGLGVGIEGASDHLVSEAIYLSDPEGNGIEIYVDRPRADWPMDGAAVKMSTLALDGASLMAEQAPAPQGWRFPAAGRIGHVHLKVADLEAAEAFYRERLGLRVMARYPGAVFMSWGGYHHHVALNVWRSRGAAVRRDGAAGLAHVDIVTTPGAEAPWDGAATARFVDPAGNGLRARAAD